MQKVSARRTMAAAPADVNENAVGLLPTLRVERFATQNLLLRRFSELSQMPYIRLEGGTASFLREFWGYMGTPNRGSNSNVLALPPDPTDFLALPTAAEELRVALAAQGPEEASRDPLEVLSVFEVDSDLASRPVAMLSGGERAAVGLAKAYALAADYDSLVMASPAVWLHPGRRHLIMTVVDQFLRLAKPVTILLLDGQWLEADSAQPKSYPPISIQPFQWKLHLRDSSVTFPGRSYPVSTPAKVIRYHSENEWLHLSSPTVIRGDNGIGKSTFALALAKVVALEAGTAEAVAAGSSGMARVLMQDTYCQMFSMSPSDHIDYAFRYDSLSREIAKSETKAADKDAADYIDRLPDAIGELDAGGNISSLLHAKISLAVERLVVRSPLLILDEPGWGLCDTLARGLVAIATATAHRHSTPVAVISHESHWMDDFSASSLLFRSTGNDNSAVIVEAQIKC